MDEETKSLVRWFLIILAGLYILSPFAALAMFATVAFYLAIWWTFKLLGRLFPSDDLAYHQPTKINWPAWTKPYRDLFKEPDGLDSRGDKELAATLNKLMAETALDKEIVREREDEPLH